MNDEEGKEVKKIFAKNKQKVDFKEGLKEIEENLEMIIENYKMSAKLHKIKFEALKKEGFSDSQAIELSKTI